MFEERALLYTVRNGLIDDAITAFNDHQEQINGFLYVSRIENCDDFLKDFTPSQILRMLCGLNVGDFIVFDDEKKSLSKVMESDLRNCMISVLTEEPS